MSTDLFLLLQGQTDDPKDINSLWQIAVNATGIGNMTYNEDKCTWTSSCNLTAVDRPGSGSCGADICELQNQVNDLECIRDGTCTPPTPLSDVCEANKDRIDVISQELPSNCELTFQASLGKYRLHCNKTPDDIPLRLPEMCNPTFVLVAAGGAAAIFQASQMPRCERASAVRHKKTNKSSCSIRKILLFC